MTTKKQGCTNNLYEVMQADLPLSCPMSDARVWDAHPRVYLPIETLGQVTCPYCNAKYVLNSASSKAVLHAPADDV